MGVRNMTVAYQFFCAEDRGFFFVRDEQSGRQVILPGGDRPIGLISSALGNRIKNYAAPIFDAEDILESLCRVG